MEDSEIAGIDEASKAAGEYLEELGKFDLRELTPNEWREFLYVAVKAYHNAPPF